MMLRTRKRRRIEDCPVNTLSGEKEETVKIFENYNNNEIENTGDVKEKGREKIDSVNEEITDESDVDDNKKKEPDVGLLNSAVSEYELQRQENIKMNLHMLEEFDIKQVHHEFTMARKPNVSVTGMESFKSNRKKREREELAKLPRRVSLRIRKVPSDNAALPPNFREPVSLSMKYRNEIEEGELGRKPEEIPMRSVIKKEEEDTSDSIKSWVDLCNSSSKKNEEKSQLDFQTFKRNMESLAVDHVGKVTKSRIFAMTVHPMEEKTLVLAGDKWGGVGIWDVGSSDDGKDEVFLFEPHSRVINCLKISPSDNKKLYSCSYDGSIRQGDLEKEKFTQIYGYDDKGRNNRFNYFDWFKNKSDSLIAASATGDVLLVDVKTGKAEQTYRLFDKSVRCVDCHPQNENFFVAAAHDGSLATWDIRMMGGNKNKYLSYIRAASRTISTCFFSPITGNKLLVTSQDDYLRVFDVDSNGLIMENSAKWPIRHNNWTGRWLTTFRACWDPKTDDCFLCGSMKQPRQVDCYGVHASGKDSSIGKYSYFSLLHENVATVCSVNAFHLTKNIFVSGNASGKVYVWS